MQPVIGGRFILRDYKPKKLGTTDLAELCSVIILIFDPPFLKQKKELLTIGF